MGNIIHLRYNILNMNLLEARKQAGLTQENIAELAGITHVTINQIEGGLVFPNKTTRQRIVFAIGEVDFVGTRLRHLKLENGSSQIATAILEYLHSSTEADRATKVRFIREILKRV